jgi:hypothetical protein
VWTINAGARYVKLPLRLVKLELDSIFFVLDSDSKSIKALTFYFRLNFYISKAGNGQIKRDTHGPGWRGSQSDKHD